MKSPSTNHSTTGEVPPLCLHPSHDSWQWSLTDPPRTSTQISLKEGDKKSKCWGRQSFLPVRSLPWKNYCDLCELILEEDASQEMSKFQDTVAEGTIYITNKTKLSSFVYHLCVALTGLPRWLSGKESACQCRSWRRLGFDPWVRKIPRWRKWQPTPVFLPGQSHGQRKGAWRIMYIGSQRSDRSELLSTHTCSLNRRQSQVSGLSLTCLVSLDRRL